MRALMDGWLRGICVGVCWFSLPRCGSSLSLFCNYFKYDYGSLNPRCTWPFQQEMWYVLCKDCVAGIDGSIFPFK